MRMTPEMLLFRDRHGLVHECEGMHEPEGQALTWTLCGGSAAHNSHAGDPSSVTCRRCRDMRAGAWIRQRPVIGWGPPELVSTSWPRSLQY